MSGVVVLLMGDVSQFAHWRSAHVDRYSLSSSDDRPGWQHSYRQYPVQGASFSGRTLSIRLDSRGVECQHPDLRPEEVYASLTYFYDHFDSMVAELKASVAVLEAACPPQPFSRAELLRRRSEKPD